MVVGRMAERLFRCLCIVLAFAVATSAEFRSHTSVEVFADDAGLDCRRGQVIRAAKVSAGVANLVCSDAPQLQCNAGGVSFSGTPGFNRAMSGGPTCVRNGKASGGRCSSGTGYLSKLAGPFHRRRSPDGLCCALAGGTGPAPAESCRNVVVATRGGGRFHRGRHPGAFEAVKGVRALGSGGGRVLLTLCQIHCPPPPPTKRGLGQGPSGLICFPGEATVQTPSGPKAMRELRIGDQIQAVGREGLGYSAVRSFHHADGEKTGRYLSLTTNSGHRLRVSATHLVYSPPDCADEAVTAGGVFRFAARLRLGDCLLVRGPDGSLHQANVTEISVVEEAGVFAPITECGTLLVDGVLASSYASLESQRLLHTVTSILHDFYVAFSKESVGVPGPLRLLFSLAKLATPALSI